MCEQTSWESLALQFCEISFMCTFEGKIMLKEKKKLNCDGQVQSGSHAGSEAEW